MNGTFHNHERDLWTSHRGDQPLGDSATWNTGSGISHVDPQRTTGGHPACTAATGAASDEQEEQCGERSGGPVGARQSLTERQPGKPVEEGTERPRSFIECDPEGRQRGDVLPTMRALRESVATHPPDHGGSGYEDDAQESRSALVNRETTGRDRTPLLSTRTREHYDAGPATAGSLLGKLDVQYVRTQLGRVRRSPCGPRELRGCRREQGSLWGGRDPVLLKVQGQLKCEDQNACVQWIYEIG